MSDVTTEKLQADLDQANMQIKGLSAQLESVKQMFNESLETSIQLRSTLFLVRQSHQEIANEKQELTKMLEMSDTHIKDLANKLSELTSSKVEPIMENV